MKFSYHNMQYPSVDPGISDRAFARTRPQDDELFTSLDEPYITLEWIYNKYRLRSQREKLSVLELGSLEGGYAIALARAGFNVTCIEARKENCDKIRWIRDKWGLTNLTIVQGDVKHIDTTFGHWKFDIVLCCGLLYHLDNPLQFLDMLSEGVQKTLIVNTHYACIDDPIYQRPSWWVRADRFIYKRLPGLYKKVHRNLSSLTTNEGMPGRWYNEYSKNATKAQIEQSLLASYSNSRSFWLAEEALTSILYAQYETVEEIFERKGHDRKIWVCEK